MKSKKYLLLVFILSSFCISGCTTRLAVSFVEEMNKKESATIILPIHQGKSGNTFYFTRLVELEGKLAFSRELKGTEYFERAILPAGRPLDLRIYIIDSWDKKGNRRRGVFECPSLEAGKTYKLWQYKVDGHSAYTTTINGEICKPGSTLLILTDGSVEKLIFKTTQINTSIFSANKFKEEGFFRAIYIQEVPTIKEYFQSLNSSK